MAIIHANLQHPSLLAIPHLQRTWLGAASDRRRSGSMTRSTRKTLGKWVPFAPIALGILLTAWAVLADRGSIASANDAGAPGASTLMTEFTSLDGTTLQASNLQK